MADREEVQDTDDYKVDKRGRKHKAHRIVFNKGEDDGKKGVSEQMKKTFSTFVEQHTPDLTEEQLNELVAELQEVLGKDQPAGKWISDFVHSDNPKFAGKSKEKRKQMALAAYYSAQRNEELKGGQVKLDKNKNGKLDKQDFKLLRKEEAEQLEEDFVELVEAYDADDYESSHEKSQFGGHRAVVKHKATGREIYVGGTAYKSAEHAKGEAEAYRKHYSAGSGKAQPGANYRHDRAVSDYRKKAKEAGHIRESFISESTAEHHEHMADQHSHHAIQHEKEVTNGGHDDHDYAATSHAEAEKAHRAAAKAHKKHGADSHEYKSAAAHAKSATSNAKSDSSHIKFKKVAKPHPISESVFDWKGKARQTDTRNTGDSTRTAHTVTKTSTGTVYTKQHDDQGVSKEFNRSGEAAQKRGRGRPKKNSFGEAVEFLMGLDEETFDSLMEEGFDAFMEQYEQLDEISKATLGSYIKKAGRDAVIQRKIGADFEHQADKSRKPGMKASATALADKYKAKSWSRSHNVNKAVDRLTK